MIKTARHTLVALVTALLLTPVAVMNAAAASQSATDSIANRVFWASQPVCPNETVLLAGHALQTVTAIEIRRLGVDTDVRQTIKPLQVTPQSLKFILPATLKMGVFECVVRGDGWSQIVQLNSPDVWWLQGDGGMCATPGGWLRAFGNSLSFGNPAEAKLTAASGAAAPLTASLGDGHSVSFSLPATLAPGSYRVTLCNGLGADVDRCRRLGNQGGRVLAGAGVQRDGFLRGGC